MTTPLRLLLVEDSKDDAELILRELRRSGYDPIMERVEHEEEFLEALEHSPQIILHDYRLPDFDAVRGMSLLKEQGRKIPCIIISGVLDDETALECVRLGAADYLLKDRLARLGPAVEKALQQQTTLEEQKKTEAALHRTEEQFRRLAENVPDIIFRYRFTGTPGFEYVSPAVSGLTGFEPEELYREPQLWANSVHPEMWGQSSLAGEDRTGVALMFLGPKVRFQKKDGRTVWLEQRVAVIHGADDSLEAVEGVIRDITENEQREREMETIVAVAGALRTAPSRSDILAVILDQISNLLKVDGVALATREAGSEESIVEAASGIWSDRSGKSIGSPRKTATDSPRDTQSADLIGTLREVVCVPLITQGQNIGALWVGRDSEISDEELRMLSAVGDIAANALRRASLHEQTQRRLQHITALRAIDMAITSSLDLRVTLNFFLDQVTIRLGINAAAVLLLDPRTQTLQYAAGRGFRTQALQHTRLRQGEGYAGRAALERRLISIPDLSKKDDAFRRAPLLLDEGFVSYFAAPLIAKGQVKGVLEIFHRQRFEPDAEWLEFLDTLAVQAAIAIDNAALFEDLQRSNVELALAYDATIEGWSRALDMRDRETEGHSLRVTEMTMRLAREMSIADDELVHIRRGALLHDIGKMGIPDAILLKPGPLSDDEWVVMRKHPEFAYELLALVNYLRPALSIPYCHHEKWDGTGYPRGLAGDSIPLCARIFAIVDVWDALRSDRPYRRPWSEDKVINYVQEQSNKHFDPKVVNCFLGMVKHDGLVGLEWPSAG